MSVRVVVALFALAACYDARPFPGAPCASNGACPSGLVCAVNGRCEAPGGQLDAQLDSPPEAAVDAAVDTVDAWDNGSCSAYASYSPTFGSNQAAYNYSTESPPMEELDGYLTAAAAPDTLIMEFYAGDGVFSGQNVHTGTFTVGQSSADLSYPMCGLCGLLVTELNTLTNVGKDTYYWNAGTVTLTSVSGTLAGSVQDLVFRQVDLNSDYTTETDDPSGCMTRIGSATFSATLVNEDSFVGMTSLGTPIRIGLHHRR